MAGLDKLRDEILSLQTARRDLCKWKLILAGGVTAAGLGFTGSSVPHAHLALCLIPFIAAYTDLLIRDYDLRITVKAAFMRQKGDDVYSSYERFIETEEMRKTLWWSFGHTAIVVSSLVMCGLVFWVGVFLAVTRRGVGDLSWIPLTGSAVAGSVIVLYVQRSYRRKKRAIHKVEIP